MGVHAWQKGAKAAREPLLHPNSPDPCATCPYLTHSLVLLLAGQVFTLNSFYFVITRRYICHDCKGKHAQKRDAGDIAPGVGGRHRDEETQFTFTPTNATTLLLEPYGHSLKFKAVLSEHSGVDESIVDWMRPLFNGGVRPATFSRALLEMHTKRHAREYLEYEHRLTEIRHQATAAAASLNAAKPVRAVPISSARAIQ